MKRGPFRDARSTSGDPTAVRARPVLTTRLFRYTAGSVVATLVSEVVLLSAYGVRAPSGRGRDRVGVPGWRDPELDPQSSVGMGTPRPGELPAGGRSVRGDRRRVATPGDGPHRCRGPTCPAVTDNIALRSILVGAAYLATSLVMFVAKFVLFDRLVFTDDARAA